MTAEDSDQRASGGPGKRGMARQLSGVVVTRLTGAVLQAGVGIALARSIAPSEYGIIVAFTGLVVFFLVLGDLGISSCIGRVWATRAYKEVAIALRINTVSASIVAVLCSVGVALSWPDRPEIAVALILIAVGQAIEKNVECAVSIFLADGSIRVPAWSIVLRRLVLVAVFASMVLLGFAAVPVYGAAVLVAGVVGWVHMRLAKSNLSLSRPDSRLVVAVLQSSFPFAINDVSIQSRSLDVAVASWLVGAFTGGLYAAATKLVAPFGMIASTIASVVLPRATNSSRAEIRSMVDLFLIVALAATGVTAVPAMFAESILRIVVGDEYRAAADCLAVMLLTLPLILLSTPLDAVLQGRGSSVLVARISSVASILMLTAVGSGALMAGATGAAVGLAAVGLAKTAVLYSAIRFSTRRLDL